MAAFLAFTSWRLRVEAKVYYLCGVDFLTVSLKDRKVHAVLGRNRFAYVDCLLSVEDFLTFCSFLFFFSLNLKGLTLRVKGSVFSCMILLFLRLYSHLAP